MVQRKKQTIYCLQCGTETARAIHKYCSNVCQMEYQHRVFIEKWQAGIETGINNVGVVKKQIKKFLREKFQNKCCICGWAEINPKTGKVPLVADHIDGNWQNNTEDNLRLICPNCDSLSPTYGALNKGHGRKDRVVSKRSLDARALPPFNL